PFGSGLLINALRAARSTGNPMLKSVLLNPVAEQRVGRSADAVVQSELRARPVIGLLNNSKPNVAQFLDSVRRELAEGQKYATVDIVKPRSAGPCPDIDRLAARCDYVINAVAD